MGQTKGMDRIKQSAPGLIALVGVVVGGSPWITGSLYRNGFMGAGLTLLFVSWVVANWQNKIQLIKQNRWHQQKKVMMAMTACMVVGLGLLIFYEIQMPKYKVAITHKELYRVPPQLNNQQLRELGAECNTYGNTLCSHDVFARLVEKDPRDYFALANLAMAQSHLGFHQFAARNFNRAIKHGVQRYDVYKLYGHTLLALKKPQQAREAYRASLDKNPNQPNLRKKIQQLPER
jgi:tetratricopeptide (TPR) repeat protein